MKRRIPLLITAIGGFVLIVSQFIPHTEGWGEVAAVWFDILAAIAFILGGGSLLKTHLKKISDRAAGWGYSGVTLIAFLVMLGVGLAKIGSRPATEQEHFGETFAPLSIADFPESQIVQIDGVLPKKGDGRKLPPSVRRQLTEKEGQLVFCGWMLPNQKQDLIDYQDELQWQCQVEKLFKKAQPPEPVKRKVVYYADHAALSFKGHMQDEHKETLLVMSDNPDWRRAVEDIHKQSQRETSVQVEGVPNRLQIPESLDGIVFYDKQTGALSIKGPLSVRLRDELANQFPVAKPLAREQRDVFRQELESRGQLTGPQQTAFDKVLDGSWTVAQLRTTIAEAGQAQEKDKTACEMFAEMNAGTVVIEPKKKTAEDAVLNKLQADLIEQFVTDEEMTVDQLVEQLKQAGPFEDRRQEALKGFLSKSQSVGERNKTLCFALLREAPLAPPQTKFLLDEYRAQRRWRRTAGALFVKAHVPKYKWSGNYREEGTPFWWLYEYAFKPLTATMFAMLAFYVASAAFRAFRAKNVEAILLLGTAFIILLGRTSTGVLLTSWLPESIAGLRIENLTVFIMSVLNTAGNRAIMIGIALGIASTSLKVLLGLDRSYLGSRED